jgi:class 3 adenylate cyclase
MPRPLDVPLLHALVPEGISYPTLLVVEFDPPSSWFELALGLVAQALQAGVPSDIHLFQKDPADVEPRLASLGLDVPALRASDMLRIIDSYTVQTGLEDPELLPGAEVRARSTKLSDWGPAAKEYITGVVPDSDRDRFHVDDNVAVLVRYNSESEVIDYWRTRTLPLLRARGGIELNALATGTASESFFRQFEALGDGVLDLRTVEQGDQVEQRIRVRGLHGRRIDSRWHSLSLAHDGTVSITGATPASVGATSPAAAPRHLAAIMFTDLEGFTRLAQQNEARALELRKEHQRLARPIFSAHGGREIKSLGDGFLVVFSSAVESVRCAIELQKVTSQHNRLHPSDSPILLRVGLHVGEVVGDGNDVVGDAVNVASRIEPLAEPGGICLTGQTVDHVRHKLSVQFQKLVGPVLRNVESPVEVYKLIVAPDS